MRRTLHLGAIGTVLGIVALLVIVRSLSADSLSNVRGATVFSRSSSGCPQSTTTPKVCGNGRIDQAEVCDTGCAGTQGCAMKQICASDCSSCIDPGSLNLKVSTSIQGPSTIPVYQEFPLLVSMEATGLYQPSWINRPVLEFSMQTGPEFAITKVHEYTVGKVPLGSSTGCARSGGGVKCKFVFDDPNITRATLDLGVVVQHAFPSINIATRQPNCGAAGNVALSVTAGGKTTEFITKTQCIGNNAAPGWSGAPPIDLTPIPTTVSQMSCYNPVWPTVSSPSPSALQQFDRNFTVTAEVKAAYPEKETCGTEWLFVSPNGLSLDSYPSQNPEAYALIRDHLSYEPDPEGSCFPWDTTVRDTGTATRFPKILVCAVPKLAANETRNIRFTLRFSSPESCDDPFAAGMVSNNYDPAFTRYDSQSYMGQFRFDCESLHSSSSRSDASASSWQSSFKPRHEVKVERISPPASIPLTPGTVYQDRITVKNLDPTMRRFLFFYYYLPNVEPDGPLPEGSSFVQGTLDPWGGGIYGKYLYDSAFTLQPGASKSVTLQFRVKDGIQCPATIKRRLFMETRGKGDTAADIYDSSLNFKETAACGDAVSSSSGPSSSSVSSKSSFSQASMGGTDLSASLSLPASTLQDSSFTTNVVVARSGGPVDMVWATVVPSGAATISSMPDACKKLIASKPDLTCYLGNLPDGRVSLPFTIQTGTIATCDGAPVSFSMTVTTLGYVNSTELSENNVDNNKAHGTTSIVCRMSSTPKSSVFSSSASSALSLPKSSKQSSSSSQTMSVCPAGYSCVSKSLCLSLGGTSTGQGNVCGDSTTCCLFHSSSSLSSSLSSPSSSSSSSSSSSAINSSISPASSSSLESSSSSLSSSSKPSGSPDLSLSLEAPGAVVEGEAFPLFLTVRNEGTFVADPIHLRLLFSDASWEVEDAPGACQKRSDFLATCELPPITENTPDAAIPLQFSLKHFCSDVALASPFVLVGIVDNVSGEDHLTNNAQQHTLYTECTASLSFLQPLLEDMHHVVDLLLHPLAQLLGGA